MHCESPLFIISRSRNELDLAQSPVDKNSDKLTTSSSNNNNDDHITIVGVNERTPMYPHHSLSCNFISSTTATDDTQLSPSTPGFVDSIMPVIHFRCTTTKGYNHCAEHVVVEMHELRGKSPQQQKYQCKYGLDEMKLSTFT